MTIDEAFCHFEQGLTQYFDDGGLKDGKALPHTQKNPKKPKGVGCEMKVLADGETNIFLHLEIVRQSSEHPDLKFAANNDATIKGLTVKQPWHCAVTLRAAEHYFDSHRTVIGDSAFASVLTAFWLYIAGLNFIGIVKQCSKWYPKELLTSLFDRMLPSERKGKFRVCVAEKNLHPGNRVPVKMNAVAWSSSSKMKVLKKIISTCGTTVEGSPHRKRGIEEIVLDGVTMKKEIHIPIARPKIVETLFASFSAVDIHDHYRQGILCMEPNWPTKNWRKRIFSTILGMHLTDAFLAYNYECNLHGVEPLCFKVFVSKIAKDLIFIQSRQMIRRPTTPLIDNQVDLSLLS